MVLLNIMLYISLVAASSCPPATAIATSLDSPAASLVDRRGTESNSISPLVIHQDDMEVGSCCKGNEGEWKCMTTTFQRCASGQWSVVLNTAYGTVCEPEGFTYDFQPAFASWFPLGDTTQTIVFTETATAGGGGSPTHVIAPLRSGAQLVAGGTAYAIWAINLILLGLTGTSLLFFRL